MPADLADRRILVTGAGSGLGAELARRLATRGARLGLLDRRAGPLAAVAAELPGAETAIADLRDAPGLTAAVDDLASRLGGLDVAVANAGIATSGPVHLTGPEAFEATIDVNLLGTWRTARAALPHLLRLRGYLLLVASAAAIQPSAHLAAYSASKAGVEAFGRVARTELRHHGVDVGVTYLSWTDTDMVRGADERDLGDRSKLPGVLGRTYPLEPTVARIVDGITRRAAHVYGQKWVRSLQYIRAITPSVVARTPRSEAIEAEQKIREAGPQATTPVGAGGAADAAARSTTRS
jgi:NAD(P)-dependent dehydrogenase (short-subunit alcohol dehydrogenase family)